MTPASIRYDTLLVGCCSLAYITKGILLDGTCDDNSTWISLIRYFIHFWQWWYKYCFICWRASFSQHAQYVDPDGAYRFPIQSLHYDSQYGSVSLCDYEAIWFWCRQDLTRYITTLVTQHHSCVTKQCLSCTMQQSTSSPMASNLSIRVVLWCASSWREDHVYLLDQCSKKTTFDGISTLSNRFMAVSAHETANCSLYVPCFPDELTSRIKSKALACSHCQVPYARMLPLWRKDHFIIKQPRCWHHRKHVWPSSTCSSVDRFS